MFRVLLATVRYRTRVSILSTPLNELDGEERALATHLVQRFRQLDSVFSHLREQSEQLAEDGEQVGKRKEALQAIAESDDVQVGGDVADAVVEEAKELGEQSIATRAFARQAQSLYTFYVEVANAVEAESLGVSEAVKKVEEIEREIEWLDEAEIDLDD